MKETLGKRLFVFLNKQKVDFWLEEQDNLELWFDAPKGKLFRRSGCSFEHFAIGNNKSYLYKEVKSCFNDLYADPRTTTRINLA